MKRVCAIGLDAATLDIIRPLVAEGRLPAFQRLMAQGAWGPLASTIHPLSPPAWSSFITGKNPGKHGIYDFVVHKPGSYELLYTYGGMRRGDSLWRILSAAGKRVVVANVPMTYPPEEVNGVLISGFDAPGVNSGFIHPPELLGEIEARLGKYQLRDYPQGETPESFLAQINRLFDFQAALADYLMKSQQWDLFIIVFTLLDHVQHAYWQYTDPRFTQISEEERRRFGTAIRDMYIRVDELLGRILEKMSGQANIAVFSDHGAGPCLKAVFVNKWLEERGYLAYANGGGSLRLLKAAHYRLKNFVPWWGLELLKRMLPGLRQKVKSKLVFSEIDWSRTRVFAFGRESTNLFVNLAGKFPEGIVAEEDYEEVLEQVSRDLLALRDPETGEPAVARVWRRDDVYHGECLDSAPDLLVEWRGHQYTSWPGYDDRNRNIFESSLKHSDYSDWSQLQKGGNHRPNGIVFLAGEGVRPGLALEGARIIDMAPTLLYWLDVPVPEDMDGRVLKAAFEQDYLSRRPPRQGRAADSGARERRDIYTEEQSRAIEERLRGLGYID